MRVICNNFTWLSYLWYCMLYVLCLCILASPRIPNMILGDKPLISEVVLSQLVLELDWGKTHTKASKKSQQHCWCRMLSLYKDYSSLLGGKLTYVFILQLQNWADEGQRHVVIFWLFTLFCCWWPYFIICDFNRTIRAANVLFCCLWRFWLFVLSL
jgi:hypothetical protein